MTRCPDCRPSTRLYTVPLPGGARMRGIAIIILLLMTVMTNAQEKATPAASGVSWMPGAQQKLETELVTKYGQPQAERARRGLKQAAEFWRAADGDQSAFETF